MNKPNFKSVIEFFNSLNNRSAIALMATTVSICALSVSIYQASLARRQQLASVWPYVSIGGQNTVNGGQQSWGLSVVNNGLGPAIVEKVTVAYEGKEREFYEMCQSFAGEYSQLPAIKNLNYAFGTIEKGTVIPAGGDIQWIIYNMDFKEKPDPATTQKHINKISITIRYKSLYGEVWESCLNCDGEGVKKIE